MNQNRLVTALALLVACPLLAAEPDSKGGPRSDKTSPPAYVIQPPDVIQIEMLRAEPAAPYRLEVFDVLRIRATTPPDQPIDNYYMIEAEGTVNLGPPYGSVHVAGLTKEETVKAIDEQLRTTISKPNVSVSVARGSDAQRVTGQYLVGPDGTINLRQYGVVKIGGKTVAETKAAIEKHLAAVIDSPKISVGVVAYDSKACYVITQSVGLGANVRRISLTGNETVLDAIAGIGGLSQASNRKMWIARPSPKNANSQRILPIDWAGITQGASTATDYQLLPGDRLFIADDELKSLGDIIAGVRHSPSTGPAPNSSGTAVISGHNSKFCYVIIQGAGEADSYRISLNRDKTILDAVSEIGGLSNVSSMWIARSTSTDFGKRQILAIDWRGITKGASAETNYQLLPGDQLFVQTYQTMGLSVNRTRNGL